jgi:hypothetical protein
MTDLALEYLSLAQQLEAAKLDLREACTPNTPGSTGKLHSPQWKAVTDKARFIVACLPRRSGKTMMEAIRAVKLCISKPNAVVWYLSFTISYGIDTFTDGCLRGLLKRFDIVAEVNEGGGYIEFPNGSSISVRGVDDVHSIEKLRGRNPPDLVFLDECQSMREQILRPMVDNIIRPALLDRAGTLIVTGTPSPVPAGFFYNIWTSGRWSRHEWSLYDNPTKTSAYYDAFLAKERADRGITEADPSYRREWLGEWAIEEELRVYKYGAINNVMATRTEFDLGNGIFGTACISRHPLMSAAHKHLWRHAVGIDIGSGDRTAIVVLGQHLNDTHVFQVSEWVINRKQEPVQSDIVNHLRWVRTEYNPMNYFFDSGGAGGKLFMTTLQRDHGFPFVEAARKTDRRGQIDSVNTWLRTGKLLVPNVSGCAEDMMKTIWDADKLKTGVWEYSPTWHPDPAEALRYCATGVYQNRYKRKEFESERQKWMREDDRLVAQELEPPRRDGIVSGDVSMDDLVDDDTQAFGSYSGGFG